MEKRMHAAVEAKREEILAFVRELVSIRSVTGQEAPVAAAVEKKLRELGFDDVQTDRTGNVIGSVGTGATTILFDGHMDTVGYDLYMKLLSVSAGYMFHTCPKHQDHTRM